MAFLLPIAEIASAIATEVGFAVGSETAGTAVGGAVAGGVAQVANNAAGAAAGYGEQKLKQTTGIDISGILNDAKNALRGFLTDLDKGLPLGATIRGGFNRKTIHTGDSEPPITQEESNSINAYLASKYIAMKHDCNCEATVPAAVKKVDSLLGPSYHMAPTIVGSSIDVSEDKMNMGTARTPNTIVPTGNKIPKPYGVDKAGNPILSGAGYSLYRPPTIDSSPIIIGRDSGKTFGKFLSESFFAVNNSRDATAALQVVLNNPTYIPIAKAYLAYDKVAKFDPQYPEIAKIYNGKTINTNSAYVEQGHFAIMDETGKTEIYTGKQAPIGTGAIGLIASGFIPPLHGVWMGPKSPNNALPVDLLDTYSFLHDIEYNQSGWFHLVGDLKYISRLSQNIDRMSFVQKGLADFAIKWFSTIGYALAKVTQGLPANVDKVPTGIQTQDFCTYLDSKTQSSMIPKSYIEFGPDYLQQGLVTVDPTKRMEFYAGLREAVEENYVKLAPASTDPTMPQYSKNKINAFKNLKVVAISY